MGSGTGRDLAELVSEGWTAYGVEPIAEMREQALQAHPHLDGLIGADPVSCQVVNRDRYRNPVAICTTAKDRDLAEAMLKKAVMIFPDIPALHGGKKGEWIILDRGGKKLFVTSGMIGTNPDDHAISRIAGEAWFSLELRAVNAELNDGPMTGLSPYEEDSVLCFEQLDLSIIGRKLP